MKFTGTGVHISEKASLGNNVRVGDYTTIYDNVTIGDDTVICDHCVIGEPMATYYQEKNYENPTTIIGKGSLVRSYSIIYCDTRIGENFSSGHRITIREGTSMGSSCRVGTMSDIQNDVTIGDYCWIHSHVFIPAKTVLENFVLIWPQVTFTNDMYPPSENWSGAKVKNYAQVGAGSVILPGVEIGEGSLVSAGSVVTKNVGAWRLVSGNPAEDKKDVREIISPVNEKPAYPWMHRFERGMPWEGIGFEKWTLENQR